MMRALLRTRGRWWALLLAVALATRLLAPEGWMPARGGGVMLCPGASVPMAMAGHHRHDMPGRAGDHACPFAQVAGIVPPPAPLGWVSPAPPPPATLVLALLPMVGRGLAAPPPPATGPPAFA